MSTHDDTRFEDSLGVVARNFNRFLRFFRWHLKGLAGLERTVLIETRWRIGDEIMAIPIYEAVKQKWKRVRVQALCNYPELIAADPYVDETNPLNANPDKYIFLREDARDRPRIGHYARLAGVEVPETPPVVRDLGGVELRTPPPRVAIAAGSTWVTKQWPIESWHELGRKLEVRGVRVVELGAGHEAAGVGESFVDETTIAEAGAIVQACDLAITNDSGLMHLAIAVGTRTIALFGPTDAAIITNNHPLLHAIDNGRDCRGCWNVSMEMTAPGECPRAIPNCMSTIAVDDVFAAAMQILDNDAAT